MHRKVLTPRRDHYTQKARIGGVRTLYLSLDHERQPNELFLRVKQRGLDAEVVALYDWSSRLISLALQYGVPLEKIAGLSLGVKVAPAGPVQGDARIKNCQSVVDYVGRHLFVHCLKRDDLAHVPIALDMDERKEAL